MLKTLFEQGIKFESFIETEGGEHKDQMIKFSAIDDIKIDLVDAIVKIDKKIKILAFAEIWCPDCVINVSALEKMHKINSNIEYIIIGRDGHEDTIKVYGDKDKAYIPTFVIMDDDFNVLGNFIERPKIIKALSDENDQVKRILMMKEYRKGIYIDESISDILKIIS